MKFAKLSIEKRVLLLGDVQLETEDGEVTIFFIQRPVFGFITLPSGHKNKKERRCGRMLDSRKMLEKSTARIGLPPRN